MEPIFIGITRSFWAAVATAALIADMGEPVIKAIATLIASVAGGDIEAMTQWGMDIAPLFTLLIAMHQRSGAARPYSLDPRKLA